VFDSWFPIYTFFILDVFYPYTGILRKIGKEIMFTVLGVYRCNCAMIIGYIERVIERGNIYTILVRKPGGKSLLARPRIK
jgi:hypothetical protein